MHSNKDTFPILLGRPWLRMSDAIVDWRGSKLSITYGPKDNRVIVSIGSLRSWMKKGLCLPSEEECDDKAKDKIGEALVGVVHPESRNTIMDSGSGGLGPRFYHYEDNGKYAQWLEEYPESEFDILPTSHHPCVGTRKHQKFRISTF